MSADGVAAGALTSSRMAEDAAASEAGATRNAGIDRIRIAMTVLVILHHTAIVYGGAGGWFWREQPNASNPWLVMFNAVNQAYFMGLFFLLAGYYTPRSYDRKGMGRFLADRLLRLGLPLLAFFFLLHPMTVALARMSEGHPFWRGWGQMIAGRAFGPGPLWFAEALLLFAIGYAAWRATWRGRDMSRGAWTALPSHGMLALAAIAIGFAAFLVRLVVPVGEEVLWLQLGYFPCYILLFVAGCAAARSRLLEHISLRQARPWMIVSAVAILLLPAVILTRSGAGAFEGGWTLNALFYALWDALVAWGVILGLFWAAQIWGRRPTPLSDWLGRGAFGAFIVHPPVIVALSVWAVPWHAAPLLKFATIGAAACAGSFIASALLRAVPGVRRII